MENDFDSAVEILCSTKSISFLPGVVGTIVAILSKSNQDEKRCDNVIDRALNHWKKNSSNSSSANLLIEILEASALRALHMERWSDAANTLKSLVDQNKNDSRRSQWQTLLMTAYSHFDISKAESLASSLPLDKILSESNINAETLEKLPLQRIKMAQTTQQDDDMVEEEKNLQNSSKQDDKSSKEEEKNTNKNRDNDAVRKRRKIKILKRRAKLREIYLASLRKKLNVDDDKDLPAVDPDRWKPIQQRASFKKSRGGSRRGRDKKYASGAQGAGDSSKKDSVKFDAAARAARGETLQNENSTASQSAATGKKRRRKKKKKGRRR